MTTGPDENDDTDAEQEKLAVLKREIAIGLADAAAGRFSKRTVAEIADDVLREHHDGINTPTRD